MAAATRNDALVRLLDGLWIADVGRRLLARRRLASGWQDDDVTEHVEIVAAIEAGAATRAEELVRTHVEAAFAHWSDRR